MSELIDDRALAFIKKYWFMATLILIICVALWYRGDVINNFIIPTYGNTMYHVGVERETIQTGYYPQTEISYGGGFPNFYVPAYRLLIVSMSVATGIDPMVMSGLMTILLSVFIILVMFTVAYRLSNNLYVGLFTAFFFLMSPDITIYTIRPLPEVLGLFMVPFTLYFVLQKNWLIAAVGALITALTHQMTLLVLVSVIGLYLLFQLIVAAWSFYKDRQDRENYMGPIRTVLGCLAPIIVACLTYGLWLMYTMGTLDILGIAQVVNHEGNQVDLPLFLRTGVFVLFFFVIGILFVCMRWQSSQKAIPDNKEYGLSISRDSALLIIAWTIATLMLTFNDKLLFGNKFLIFPNFMDRYLTFFVQIAIILAGFGMYALLSAFDLDVLKVKP